MLYYVIKIQYFTALFILIFKLYNFVNMLDVTYVFSLFITEIRMHDMLHIFLLFLSITLKFCLFFRSFFYKMSTDLADSIPIPISTQKKIKEDDHLILFEKTFNKEILLALANFLPLANIVIFNENAMKFQNLKNTF